MPASIATHAHAAASCRCAGNMALHVHGLIGCSVVCFAILCLCMVLCVVCCVVGHGMAWTEWHNTVWFGLTPCAVLCCALRRYGVASSRPAGNMLTAVSTLQHHWQDIVAYLTAGEGGLLQDSSRPLQVHSSGQRCISTLMTPIMCGRAACSAELIDHHSVLVGSTMQLVHDTSPKYILHARHCTSGSDLSTLLLLLPL